MFAGRRRVLLIPIAILATWLACGSVAQARLGENLAQLKARFREPVKVTALQIPVATEYVFKGDRDIAVLACLRGGACEKITYYRQGQRLTDEEIQQLLTVNGRTWIPAANPTWEFVKHRRFSRSWQRDGSAVWAECGPQYSTPHYLSVMTFDWLKAEVAAEAAEKERKPAQPKKLEGF